MRFDNKRNIIYFDNDDDFFNFAVIPALVIRDGKHGKYTDFDFSKDYLEKINNGTRFVIEDVNSRIMKNGHINFRTITKNVENIEYGE